MNDKNIFFSSTSPTYTTNAEIINPDNNCVYTSSPNTKINDTFLMAKAFLSIESMTHKKLQKLCYYAKAWHLALYGENIIFDNFEAWVHGAVQPEMYQYYKKYGFEKIPRDINSIGMPEEFMSFAHEIYDSYGHLTGDELEALNHTESPWINARKGYQPWENCNNIISEDDMKNYYRKKLQ